MQRVWNFPTDAEPGCPRDRESSGDAGIRVKTKNQSHVSLLSGGCAHLRVSALADPLSATDSRARGGAGGLDKPEGRKPPPALW